MPGHPPTRTDNQRQYWWGRSVARGNVSRRASDTQQRSTPQKHVSDSGWRRWGGGGTVPAMHATPESDPPPTHPPPNTPRANPPTRRRVYVCVCVLDLHLFVCNKVFVCGESDYPQQCQPWPPTMSTMASNNVNHSLSCHQLANCNCVAAFQFGE